MPKTNIDLHNLNNDQVSQLLSATEELLWLYSRTNAARNPITFRKKFNKETGRILSNLGLQGFTVEHINVYLVGTTVELRVKSTNNPAEILIITFDIRPQPINLFIVSVDRFVDHQKQAGVTSSWYIPSVIDSAPLTNLNRRLTTIQKRGHKC